MDRLAGVAAGHEATAAAAAEVLRAGGGAVDAAVAGVWAACVAEPILTGPLGAGLMAYAPPGEPAVLLDFFAETPGRGASPAPNESLDFVGVDVSFGPTTQVFHIGRGSAAVPGTVAGLFDAHRRWGRLPMADLVAPACRLAREGAEVSARMAQMMSFLRPILVHSPGARALYAPGGELPGAGERFRNPELADSLEELARRGPAWAYEGELARAVVDLFGPDRGLLNARDLASYQVKERTPLTVRYRGCEAVLPPPPTAGGPLVAHALGRLAGRPAERGVEAARSMAQAMRSTNEARAEVLNVMGSTTHVSVVDADGGAVAVTTSNGESCGWLVPGTGIAMNNFLGEEDINPAGFHAQPPGQRMMTMMCPSILRQPDGRTTVMGSGGSNRIRSAVLQVIVALADDPALDVAQAVRAPRMHAEGPVLHIEGVGLPPGALEALDALFDEVVVFEEPNMFFGGVHCVRAGGAAGVQGAGDFRRGGVFCVV